MKTLHLSIIVFIIGISFVVNNNAHGCNYCPMISTSTNVPSTFTISTNLENYTSSDKIMITVYVPSPDNNSSLAIKILGPGYNLVDLHTFRPDSNQVGYTWTVLPNGPLFYNSGNYTVSAQYGQNHAVTIFYLRSTQSLIIMGYPSSPLQQIKSGIKAQDVKCNQGLQLIFKVEYRSPACVNPTTANILIKRGWGTTAVNTIPNIVTNIQYQGIDKPSGIVLIDNQTYYLTTFNGTFDSILSNGTDISFHGVLFTLLRPQQSNGNGDLFVVDVKFVNDNTNESLVIYPVGVGAIQQDRVLSKHTHPQVGFLVYHEKTIKLLVSTDVNATSTQTQTSDSSSALKLYLSTSSQVIQPGQPIGITISVNNTLSNQIMVQDENSWKLNNLSSNPCTSMPYGIAIFDGFYTEQNMTDGRALSIFNPHALCPLYNQTTQGYVFQPSSGHVTVNNCTDTPSSCASVYDMENQFSFSGSWNSGQIQPFKSGLYTIVGGDEWGNVAIEHFVVSNSTIFAGDLGRWNCPMMYGGVQFGATIKNSTGFANYYNSTQYGNTFFLHPGMQGTINVQYSSPADAAWFQNKGNAPFNMTNSATLSYMANVAEGKSVISYAASLDNDETGHHSTICHYGIQSGGGFEEPCNTDNTGDIPLVELPYASRLLHVGISTSFEPNSVMFYPDSNPISTTTVSANSDATPGVYWLYNARYPCGPGVLAKLVVLPQEFNSAF